MAINKLNDKPNCQLKSDLHTANIFNNMINNFDYLIVTDLEMTCVENRDTNFQPETIEIGCAAVSTQTLEIIDTFSMLVKPSINPTLSQFCVSLTNITQQEVDSASEYPVVATELQRWLSNFDNSAFVAWGTGDHKRLNIDAKYHSINSPISGFPVINLKLLFKNLGFAKRGFGLAKALNIVGIEQGTAHRALPDAINTAKLLPFMRKKALATLNNQLTTDQVESYGKLLTLILRHMPSKALVTVDDQGWCDVSSLINGLRNQHRQELNERLIREVCFRDSGNRFQLSQDETKIRCLQGHSLPHIKINFLPVKPNVAIYHGTSVDNLAAIKQSGAILKMSRNFVHLTASLDKAISSGKRYGKPVVLKIDTNSMCRDGYGVYIAENGVYLADTVPLMYFRVFKL
ncbi:RNA 2'-phosphotransferase [Photobacterium damselae]|uniref:RNA 2'-phosphotransferase n=1 Tax=Photobacterium damselae TaxID=38293 RepID=UPI0040681249